MDKFRKDRFQVGGYSPFHGRTVTRRPAAQLTIGELSVCNNFRNYYPGIRKRGGMEALHSEAFDIYEESMCGTWILGNGGPAHFSDVVWTAFADSWTEARDGGPSRMFLGDSTLPDAPMVSVDYGFTAQNARAIMMFDISGFVGTTITDATLRIETAFDAPALFGGPPNFDYMDICLVDVTAQVPPFFEIPDIFYDFTSNTLISDNIFTPSGVVGAEYTFTFNAAGLQHIQDVLNGIYGPGTIMGLMIKNYSFDYLNTPPVPTNVAYLYAPRLGADDSPPACHPDIPLFTGFASIDRFPISNWQFTKSWEEDPDTADFERHTFVQLSDGILLKATNEPPVFTAGVFGPLFYDSGDIILQPASYADIDGIMIFSDAISQHQLWAGNRQKIKGAHYDSQTYNTNFDVLSGGSDIWEFVVGNDSLDYQFGGLASTDVGLMVCCQTPADILNFVITQGNTNASPTRVLYWRGYQSGWGTATIVSDTTLNGSDGLAGSGSVTFTKSTAEVPATFAGITGYWYRIVPNGSAWSTITISSITYGNQEFVSLEHNLWDGISRIPAEVQVYDASDDKTFLYAAGSVVLNELTSSDRIYIGTADKVQFFEFDPGEQPNDNVSNTATITAVRGWKGVSFSSISFNDGSSGFSEKGQVTLYGSETLVEKHRFNDSNFALYWYEIQFTGGPLSEQANLSVTYAPVMTNVSEDYGAIGISNAAFKDRAAYSFNRFPHYLYVSSTIGPNVLSGTDFAILRAGDGRPNKIISMKKFHNELLVHQQERGMDGGCTTIFEGYSPSTFGRLVLSTRVGALNEDAVTVIDGPQGSVIRTDETAQTRAYWISRYGIYQTDGRIVTRISQDIQNYFDPRFPECLTKGKEGLAWAAYDSSCEVVRFGICSGEGAELPNVFPVYDLTTGDWLFDTFEDDANAPTTVGEVDAGSGSLPVIQMNYSKSWASRFNYGLNDNGDAIDAVAYLEMNAAAALLDLREVWIRMLAIEGAVLTFDILEDSRTYPDHEDELDMSAEETGDDVRRHRLVVNATQETHLTLVFRNNEIDTDTWLYDYSVDLGALGKR